MTTAQAHDLVPDGAALLLVQSFGFPIDVDERELFGLAVWRDVAVLVERNPGDPVVSGTPVGWVWPVGGGGALVGERREEVLADISALMYTSFERATTTDLSIGLRQLTDVASKALSPGINDPTTAEHALGHASVLLCQLARMPLGPRVLRDDDHHARVVLSRPMFGD